MRRRELLGSLGMSMGLVAGWPFSSAASSAPSDPLTELHHAFAAARKQHALLAGWESITPPGTRTAEADIQGTWPKTLRGRLFRNGPGLWDRGSQRYRHWFDGDGLIQRWTLVDGMVKHRAQFVQTPKMRTEQAAGRFVLPAAGTTIDNARGISGPDDLNVANTAVLAHAGKMYALWEAGSAFEFDGDSLQTTGAKSWSAELEQVPFSAHPLRDAEGNVWNYGHMGRNLVLYRIDADGQLRESAVHQLPRGGYMHSFAMTATRLIFVLAPLVMGELRGSFFESLQWRPQLGTLAIVIDKSALAEPPRLIELDPGIAYHYADAIDLKDGSIALRGCWSTEGDIAVSPMAQLMRGHVTGLQDMSSRLVTLLLPTTRGRGRIEPSAVADVEFPTMTAVNQLLLLQASGKGPPALLDTLLQVDRHSKALQQYRMNYGIVLEEALPITATDDRPYVISTAFDTRRPASGLLLFDARRIAAGPVAQAWLERALPLGFHGAWVQA